MTPCGEYGSFCCGQDDDSLDCCKANNGSAIGSSEVLECGNITTISTTTTITATATATPPSNNSACTGTGTVTQGQTTCKTEKGAAIGLGATLGCALLLLVVLGMQLLHKMKELERVKPRRPMG